MDSGLAIEIVVGWTSGKTPWFTPVDLRRFAGIGIKQA
jgi:hypothetical protein